MCACVRACVCACACVCMCVCVVARACMRACVRAYVLVYVCTSIRVSQWHSQRETGAMSPNPGKKDGGERRTSNCHDLCQ